MSMKQPIPFPKRPDPAPDPDGHVYFTAFGRRYRIRYVVEEVPPAPAPVVPIKERDA